MPEIEGKGIPAEAASQGKASGGQSPLDAIRSKVDAISDRVRAFDKQDVPKAPESRGSGGVPAESASQGGASRGQVPSEQMGLDELSERLRNLDKSQESKGLGVIPAEVASQGGASGGQSPLDEIRAKVDGVGDRVREFDKPKVSQAPESAAKTLDHARNIQVIGGDLKETKDALTEMIGSKVQEGATVITFDPTGRGAFDELHKRLDAQGISWAESNNSRTIIDRIEDPQVAARVLVGSMPGLEEGTKGDMIREVGNVLSAVDVAPQPDQETRTEEPVTDNVPKLVQLHDGLSQITGRNATDGDPRTSQTLTPEQKQSVRDTFPSKPEREKNMPIYLEVQDQAGWLLKLDGYDGKKHASQEPSASAAQDNRHAATGAVNETPSAQQQSEPVEQRIFSPGEPYEKADEATIGQHPNQVVSFVVPNDSRYHAPRIALTTEALVAMMEGDNKPDIIAVSDAQALDPDALHTIRAYCGETTQMVTAFHNIDPNALKFLGGVGSAIVTFGDLKGGQAYMVPAVLKQRQFSVVETSIHGEPTTYKREKGKLPVPTRATKETIEIGPVASPNVIDSVRPGTFTWIAGEVVEQNIPIRGRPWRSRSGQGHPAMQQGRVHPELSAGSRQALPSGRIVEGTPLAEREGIKPATPKKERIVDKIARTKWGRIIQEK